MKAQMVQCPGCGADLPPTAGTVTCEYCGKQTVLRPTGEMQRPVVVVQHGGDVQKRTNKMVAMIVGISVIGMIPAIVVPIIASRAADTAIEVSMAGPNPAAAGQQAGQQAADQARRAIEQALGKAGVALPQNPGAPQVRSRICLLDDVNGDGAAEVSAFISANSSDRSKRPAILDGANGSVLWQGDSLGESNDLKLLCAGPHWVTAVNNESFELVMVNARDTTKQVRRALSDELERWSTDIAGTYGQVNELYYNGRFVVVGVMDRAIALDPASGQIAWQLGG